MLRILASFRLRWLWHEWKAEDKLWVGSEVPCNNTDRKLFAACTRIVVGDGAKTSFWNSAWVQGQRPKDMAPSIFSISKRKNRSLRDALHNRTWIRDININHSSFSVQHFREYVLLWQVVQQVALRPGVQDEITWKFTADGNYSAKSAYAAQFIGSASTNFDSLIWKIWAPRSCKTFSWLAIQNRLWTADRLQKRGWPNPATCPLCRRSQESALHLFAECRVTTRIWAMVADWLSAPAIHPRTWQQADTLHHWWSMRAGANSCSKRGMRTLIMLVTWTIWRERNMRIFNSKESSVNMIFERIKDEATVWIMAGAKHLSALMVRC
ncbi:uncharacterized protein LOC101760247 isoform X1 [Setaria italica]|uniref:uncharacterized protein LOC101760247 isoform X1 n=1 Tax=Setaria italica TaxID=4555 RepID=UPI000BE61B2D|nr:uncharacterized protein LOC101760247 isoform X1 [Setaria italica]